MNTWARDDTFFSWYALSTSHTLRPSLSCYMFLLNLVKGNHLLAHTIALCGFDPDFATLSSEEIDIYDFEPYAVSAFAQLLMEKENMMAWNQFISQSEEDQQSFLKSIIDEEDDVAGDRSQARSGSSSSSGSSCNENGHHQHKHPAFSPEMSFARIDDRIKKILRKNRRIPMVSSMTSSLFLPGFRDLNIHVRMTHYDLCLYFVLALHRVIRLLFPSLFFCWCMYGNKISERRYLHHVMRFLFWGLYKEAN